MRNILFLILALLALSASAQERLLLLNEGTWQADNGTLTYFADGAVQSNAWFRQQNGMKLGDTPNDIILAAPNLIAIAVNTSNVVQFIDTDGRAVAATEDIPNNRRLASDGQYVYVTSYAHECQTSQGLQTFTRGFVAKIDIKTFAVVSATEVGYEPEGIALYDGHLFVANTGGYGTMEGHDYEQTITILNATDMSTVGTIDTGCPNLYGQLSQAGQYLCVSSAGDYYETPAATVIVDCQKALQSTDASCFTVLPCASTYSTPTTDSRFLCVGAQYSYLDGGYQFNYLTIDPALVMTSQGADGVSEELPGTMAADIAAMAMPYGIYVNPNTGYLYATDAGQFVSAGGLYQWSPDGKLLGKHKVYINPGHFLALPPAGAGLESLSVATDASPCYDLYGRPAGNARHGQPLIHQGKITITY